MAVAATAIVLVEALSAIASLRLPGLALVAIVVAPGLACAAVLPAPIRRHALALACAIPVLGWAISSIAFITIARLGVPLDPVTTRLALALTVAAGLLALPFRDRVERPQPSEAALLGAAIVAGAILQGHVLHGYPVPGNDWAKYLLYADEIRRQGSLLIENPYWMLGVPFREDPGVPSLYGSFLVMSGEPAGTLAHGIWLFALLGIGSVFAYVRSIWGATAGGLAALLYAVVPMNQDILGWHGLANVAALCLMPLVLAYATQLLRGRLDTSGAAGFAIVLVALAAAHRLSFSLTLLVIAAVSVVALAIGPRRRIVTGGLITAAWIAAIGWGVALDLIARNRTFGGTQGYEAYLESKLDLDLVILDLTWPFSILAIAAAGWALWRLRRDPALGIPIALLAVSALLGYSWAIHFPLSYLRMAYYLPLALAPLAAVAIVHVGRRRPAVATGLGVLVCAVIAVLALGRGDNVRRFYSFADPTSLKGLDLVAGELAPNEVVATDRCWSFLSTWLLRTRTFPALAPDDIQPKAELPTAEKARQLLAGLPGGVRAARRLGVRFILVDPTCTDPTGRPLDPPLIGRPSYVSGRLVVLRMPADPRSEVGRGPAAVG